MVDIPCVYQFHHAQHCIVMVWAVGLEKYTFRLNNSMKILTCDQCGEDFEVNNNQWKVRRYAKSKHGHGTYCCRNCQTIAKGMLPAITTKCSHCGEQITKQHSQCSDTNNYFCSQSCAATYNNTHKTKGNRRSKLEKWLEEQLTILYPTLHILYSDKTTINSELDIYIPSLKLAFELNGIFHYEPIFGDTKLDQIQNNDHRKFQACLDHKVELCIIDTSQHTYVKPSTSQKYLDIIIKILNEKL
jgi:hypothetical protein